MRRWTVRLPALLVGALGIAAAARVMDWDDFFAHPLPIGASLIAPTRISRTRHGDLTIECIELPQPL